MAFLLALSAHAGSPWSTEGTLPVDVPVTALAMAPSHPDVAYAGTAGRGIFYSLDGGVSWQPSGPMPFATVLTLAVNPQDAAQVLAGTYGGGVYMSNDGGKNWSPLGLRGKNVVALAVRPTDGLIVAAADGPWPGIYRSGDGGRSWQGSARAVPDGAYPTSLCVAGERFLLGVRWTAGGYVLYSSPDGSDWQAAGQGLPDELGQVTSMACYQEDVWAVTRAGVVHGKPEGTWVVEGPLPEGQMGSIAFGNGKLYMATAKGIYFKIPGGWHKQVELTQQGLIAFGGDAAKGYRFLTALRSGAVMGYSERPTVAAQPTPVPIARGLPTDPVRPPDQPSDDVAYFPETGHTIARGFLAFWKANGGLAVFGYPLTEEFTENGRTVQYFERARMEYYPEYAGTPNVIQLGQLGREYTKGRYFLNIDFFPSKPDRYFFPETEHSLAGAFLRFWTQNGAVRLFGYPISEEMNEDGLTVQYFERARFEYHPDNPNGEVQLTDLGRRILVQRGWLSGR